MVQRSGAVVVLRLIICATIVPFIMARAAEAQLLNSWEGSTEGWNSQNGAVLVNSASRPGGAKGVTDGTDSLAVTLPNQGYLRWGDRVLEGAALDAVVAAAGSETGIGVVEFDVTYDTSEIPQGTVTYVNHQLAMQTNAGWSQVDITAPTYPQTNGSTDETAHFLLPLSLFGSLSGTSTSVQMLFAASGDWGDGQQATLFYDNLRVSALEPDLNNDNVVNVLDWEIFIENHKQDLSDLSLSDRFSRGDFNVSGVSDFDDYLVFESRYDAINGAGALAAVRGVPEPAALVLAATVFPLFLLRRRRGRVATFLLLVALASAASPQFASGQLLHSFETDTEGWVVADFHVAFPTDPTLSLSSIGATEGVQSLGVTQPEDGFSWDAQVSYGTGSDGYNIFANAVEVGTDLHVLEFDVTFDQASIPQDIFFNASVSVALNSNGGWMQYDNVAEHNELGTTATVPVQIALDGTGANDGAGTLLPASSTGFYQINIGLNGFWGLSPATIYFDNFRITQIATPEVLTLEVDRGTGQVSIKNDATGQSFGIDYYELKSEAGSLSSAGWNSLDAQNVNAVDGSDAGTIAGDSPLEGWDAAGGASANDLTEAFLGGSSNLADNAVLNLGAAFTPGATEDLIFRYRDTTRPDRLAFGEVVYVGEVANLPGDYNGNGVVDAADYTVWKDNFGSTTELTADGNGNSVIDAADYTVWKDNFGNTASAASVTSVPEPVSGWAVLSLAGIAAVLMRRRYSRQ